jgi:Immunoglobulin-like domain of bacterial spore germination
MMTAIRVRMPAPLQFVPHDHLDSIIAHLGFRPVDPPLSPERVRPARGERVRAAAAVALGCLLVGCSGTDRVTEPLTSSPPVPTMSSGPATTAVEDPAIAIETPFVDGEVGSPVSVTGTAEVVDAALTVRVLGEDANELAAIVVRASCGDGCRGTFGTQLFFFIERTQPGTIEVSGVGGDGERALASVPVVLFPQ